MTTKICNTESALRDSLLVAMFQGLWAAAGAILNSIIGHTCGPECEIISEETR